MAAERDLSQIYRLLKLSCPVCNNPNTFYRLKANVCWPLGREEDGHPLEWGWQIKGFENLDPLRFFFSLCHKCYFAAETENARFRGCTNGAERFRADYSQAGLQWLLLRSVDGRGVAQVLGKNMAEGDLLCRTVVTFHLGIFSECLRRELSPGTLARFYLRLAWVYRQRERYYADTDLAELRRRLKGAAASWAADLPKKRGYPVEPALALSEGSALRQALAFFERNFTLMTEGGLEDELRFKRLVAGIGFRLYRLSGKEEVYQQALRLYSDLMESCLEIIHDRSIVGGVVGRAREFLGISGDNSRKLRQMHKRREAHLQRKNNSRRSQ